MSTYITLPSLSTNKVLTASYLNLLNDNLRVISLHNHSGSIGEGNTTVNVASAASPFVYRIEAIAHMVPSQVRFSSFVGSTSRFFERAVGAPDTVSPQSACFPVNLMPGTYEMTLMSLASNANGIASGILSRETFGASTIGEFDTYTGGTTISDFITRATATFRITTSASYILEIIANGKKNALSSGSSVTIQAFKLRRVAS